MSGSSGDPGIVLAKIAYNAPGLKGAISIVPFKGGVPALTALLGGHVDSTFQTAEWKPHVEVRESPASAAPGEVGANLPDAPTFQDLGYRQPLLGGSRVRGAKGLPDRSGRSSNRSSGRRPKKPRFRGEVSHALCIDDGLQTREGDLQGVDGAIRAEQGHHPEARSFGRMIVPGSVMKNRDLIGSLFWAAVGGVFSVGALEDAGCSKGLFPGPASCRSWPG